MKKLFFAFACVAAATSFVANAMVPVTPTEMVQPFGKIDIKIKNDSGDEVTVLNAGSGGTYRLSKNVTTTIKMDEGDKLYMYEGGKKGKLLLTASADMNGKVQLFSKL
ncbi:hypothetical protein ACFOWM_07840 [Ferruginibacter yonginensis]|uniref:Uncharacterized protein n=1 Tax=Ferruginibacter yonginensis TaxID=1310416 RepID=A0ABV8QR89_9BACT